jgi:hypothetical protein
VVKARGLELGGARVAMIDGPSPAASEKQLVPLAHYLKALWAMGLRGGRLSPGPALTTC